MCCHQCSTSASSPTVPERQLPSPSSAARSSWRAPLIQINYTRNTIQNMTSAGIDGPGRGHAYHEPPVLSRASTVSSVPASPRVQSQVQQLESESATCCSGGVNRAHSIHLCLHTGRCHHEHCSKDHLSQKLAQGLRRKLSFLNKLRVKSDETQSPRKRGCGVSQWLRDAGAKSPTTPSQHAPDFENQHQAQRDSTVVSEVAGDYVFPAAELGPQDASIRAASRPDPSFSELSAISAFELREHHTLPPATPDFSGHGKNPPAEPLQKMSGVSALSSFDMSGSEGQWSHQVSQSSIGFNDTPATSMSENDLNCAGVPFQSMKGSGRRPRRQLTLNTHLAVPQGLVTDGPVTDSPTSGNDGDFAGLRVNGNKWTGIVNLDQDTVDFPLVAELEAEVPEISAWLPPSSLLSPEELVISSPPPAALDSKDWTASDPTNMPAPPVYATDNRSQTANDPLAARVLASCREFADAISIQSQSGVLTFLEDIFDATVSYYLSKAKQVPDVSDCKLAKAWEVSPTLEAALMGMHRLEAGDRQATPYQLMSLALFSLSLICVAINDKHDLAAACQRLHSHTRLLSTMVHDAKEKRAFEILVDDLWLSVEQSQYPEQLLEVTHDHSFPVDAAQHSLLLCNNLVVQVAQVLVMFTAGASLQLLGSREALYEELDPPPSFNEVMSQIQREESEESASDYRGKSELFQRVFCQAQQTGLLESYEVMQRYVNHENNNSEAFDDGASRRGLSSFLKTLGSRYVGRVALWLYERLQRTAERVMTHPQDPWSVERIHTPPPKARCAAPNRSDTAALFQVKGSPSKKPQLRADNSPPYTAIKKPATPRKRKSSSDGENSENLMYECKEHKKHFTGPFAYDSYQRHLKHTKQHQHGNLPFTCHICEEGLARIDHFKTHMWKHHQVLVDGRAGNYTFRSGQGPVGAVPELDAITGIVQDAGQDWNGYMPIAAWS